MFAAFGCFVSPSTEASCTSSPSPPSNCTIQIDFALLLDESGSTKSGSTKRPDEPIAFVLYKGFAKELLERFPPEINRSRFSVVSFNANASTRVGWSYNTTEIELGIDQLEPNGETSISDGFEAVRHLFDNSSTDGRESATKVVLLLSDGRQTVDKAYGRTLLQTAVDAAELVREKHNATVFAWGFGNKVNLTELEMIASDRSVSDFANKCVCCRPRTASGPAKERYLP